MVINYVKRGLFSAVINLLDRVETYECFVGSEAQVAHKVSGGGGGSGVSTLFELSLMTFPKILMILHSNNMKI